MIAVRVNNVWMLFNAGPWTKTITVDILIIFVCNNALRKAIYIRNKHFFLLQTVQKASCDTFRCQC
jgi:hypothetical protein